MISLKISAALISLDVRSTTDQFETRVRIDVLDRLQKQIDFTLIDLGK